MISMFARPEVVGSCRGVAVDSSPQNGYRADEIQIVLDSLT